jgi:hypothetical protein
MSDYNLEQPHALPHVPTETVYICPTQSELAPARGWGEPDKKLAKLHMDLAAIALDVAYNNGRVIDVVVGHLEDAIKALRPVNPNDQAEARGTNTL